jgi:hypothetical protein
MAPSLPIAVSRRLLGVLLAVVLLGGSAGIVAAVTADPGPFVGCLADHTNPGQSAVKGQIYNVAKAPDPLAPCVKGDALIAISNGAGPEGPGGPQGPAGLQGPAGPQGPQGEPAALIPATKFFNADNTPIASSRAFEFGETINVTSMQIGDVGAGLKELLPGDVHQSIVLYGTLAGGTDRLFLWEGPRTAQLTFAAALPLTAVTALCITPAGECDLTFSVVGY